jgi:hypothetical protein
MWDEYGGSAFDWDRIVASFDNAHPTHQYRWTMPGQKNCKVRHLLYVSSPGSSPTAAIQLLHKQSHGLINYFRSDGGLAGDHSTLRELSKWLNDSQRCKRWYLRVFSRAVHIESEVAWFNSSNFLPVQVRIHSGLSAMLTLSNPYRGTYSGNWKHNLARGVKKGLVVCDADMPSLNELISIYKELETVKNIGVQFNENELKHLMCSFGSNLVVAGIRSSSGELLSVRAALCFGGKAYDLLAATSEAGRLQYASNLAFHTLLEKCAGMGIVFYDCAGIDPVNGKGVMQFKMGAGGAKFEYGGEWELASKNYIRIAANALLRLKLALKKK